jgi:hypothetical protein
VLQGNREKMPEICGYMVGQAEGFPCFLLDGDPVGNAPIPSPLLYEHFPKCVQYFVSVAERSPIPFGHFPKSRQYSLATAHMVSKVSNGDICSKPAESSMYTGTV